jgi:hypothetical protein
MFSSCENVLNTLATKYYTSVTISKVTIIDFAHKKSNGLSWDPFGGRPDIYFKIGEDGFKRQIKKDVDIGTTPVWILQSPYVMNNIYSDVNILFYDADQEGLNISGDDYMGSVNFSPMNFKGQDKVIINSTENPKINIQLDLIWN